MEETDPDRQQDPKVPSEDLGEFEWPERGGAESKDPTEPGAASRPKRIARARELAESSPAAARRIRSRIPVSPLHPLLQRRLVRLAGLGLVAGIVALLTYSVIGGGSAGGPVKIPEGISDKAARAVRGLSFGEKVNQVLLAPPGRALPAQALGGVFVGPDQYEGGALGRKFVESLQGSGRNGIGPLIATSQEGGEFRALLDLPPAERAFDIGRTGDPKRAEKWGRQTARALVRTGFDLNLAPNADVATLDSPLAGRAFGDDESLVAALTVAALRGCNAAGIACAVSHFPGLGAASADTRTGPATVGLDQASLAARDLVPFKAAIKAKVPAVVLSLAFYSAYDAVTPAALEPAIADELLRDELGFDGVAITDDLSSGAIAGAQGAPEAAVDAINAGADMVFISKAGEAAKARGVLLQAARDGKIPRERLDAAVARVLELKKTFGLVK